MASPAPPRLFRLHDAHHLARYFEDIRDIHPLRLWHLPFLRPTDALVTSRFVCHLFEFLFLFFPRRRPLLVRVADGISCEANRRVPRGHRYGDSHGMNLFADVLLVRQNLEDFKPLMEAGCPALSVLEARIEERPRTLTGPTAVLVASNNPFFDYSPRAVVEAFRASAARLRAFGFTDLRLSCPDPRLSIPLLRSEPDLKPIGRMRDQKDLPDGTLCVGSPSTALFDAYLGGHPCLLISHYQDAILERYLTYDSVLETPEARSSRQVLLKTCAGSTWKKIPLNDLAPSLARRRPPMDRRLFLFRLRPKQVLAEIAFLLGLRS